METATVSPVNYPNIQHDGACASLVGKELVGSKGGKWYVLEKLQPKNHGTGGTFSIGYIVRNESGDQAFMKSTDIRLLTRGGGDMLSAMQRAANEQSFERSILDFCQGNSMDKIVHALDYGETPVVHNNVQDMVFFIVFELADGDARSVVNPGKGYDFIWALGAMHSLAVAVQQLHTKSIAHNDIKPSNLLVFARENQKLADMGRATSEQIVSPFAHHPHPGDMSYAAPEQIYRTEHRNRFMGTTSFDERRASDLYLLGSMGLFFILGLHTTYAVTMALRSEFMAINWQGTFDEVLPEWRNAFGKVMARAEDVLMQGAAGKVRDMNKEFLEALRQLCEPDPNLRGHPSNRLGQSDKFGVDRYIALFDRLRSAYAIYLTR